MLQAGTPSTAVTTLGGLQCVTGRVTLFQFIVQPPPGSVIGQVTPQFGSPIPLIQTRALIGGTTLAQVNGQFAQVCGVFTTRGNQAVLDVRLVNGISPIPTPINPQLLLLLLLILLLSGRLGTTGISGLGNIQGLLSGLLGQTGTTTGLGDIQGLLGSLGLGQGDLTTLLQSLTGGQQGI